MPLTCIKEMYGKAVNKTYAKNAENPTPRDSPNNECIIKANAHASLGLGVLLAKIPFPIAGIKNSHGTKTLTTPNTRPWVTVGSNIPSCNRIKNA